MSKMNANTEYASGAVKENAGHVTGSDNLRAQGRAEKEIGNANYNTADNYDRADYDTTGATGANNRPSKTGGHVHATKGAVKENLGSIFKSGSLENTGARERREGNRDIENARTRDMAGGKTNQVKGTVKEKTGHAVGNPQLETEGRGEHIGGRAQYHANK